MAVRVLRRIGKENARHLQIVTLYSKKKNHKKIPQIQSPLAQVKVLLQVVLCGATVGFVPSEHPVHIRSVDPLKDRNFALLSQSLHFAEHMNFLGQPSRNTCIEFKLGPSKYWPKLRLHQAFGVTEASQGRELSHPTSETCL